ncbi:MAG: peptidoglycan DD-metalloendopeptidase family protein [Alphaproteobacteria bacterium]|nr:peptidoglycan DD-metalloendopeptidase family protein [Alphaproteobacteria bacterium]
MAVFRTHRVFLCLLCPGLLAVAGMGGAVAAGTRVDVQNEIQRTETSIREGRARQKKLTQQTGAVTAQVDALRLAAAHAAQQAQDGEAALSAIEVRLTQLQAQDHEHRRRLSQTRLSMARTISALTRVERQPAVALLAAPGTMLDTVRGGRLLAAALPALHRDAARIGIALTAADDVRRRLGVQQQRHQAAARSLSSQRQSLEEILARRAKSEQSLRQAGAREGQRLAMLASKARDLHGLMQRLDGEAHRKERLAAQRRLDSEKQRAVDLERELRAEQDRRITAKAVTDAATNAATDEAARRATQRRNRLAADMARTLNPPTPSGVGEHTGGKSQHLAMAPAAGGGGAFSKLRGRLRLPARGSRVGHYGESTGFGPRAQGITLRTRPRAQVVAPHDGRIVFAGPFLNYGLILIISHGEGYHSLLAGLSKLQTVVGQSVLAGEPVGVMGGDGKRSLYVELRRKGTAIDPNPWWSSSRERASG